MIAISYRREDSLPVAGRLYDRLQTKFGRKNIFMDFDSIPPGVDFRDHIRETIERADVVIAIIGPGWLGEQQESGRRIDNPTDFVRLEIAHALERGIPIIPVLVNDTEMPKPENLPSDVKSLAFRNALPLDTGRDFHHHAERLITGISRLRDSRPTPANRRSKAFNRGLVVAVTLAASLVAIWYVVSYSEIADRLKSISKPKQESVPAAQAPPAPSQSISMAAASVPAKLDTAVSGTDRTGVPPKPESSITAPNNQHVPKLARIYVKKYDVSALLPEDVFPDAKKLSDSDQFFLQGQSWSGQTTLTFSSVRAPIAKVYADCAMEHSPQNPSKTVQYKISKPTWFVVSGDLGPEADTSVGFYTKGVKKGDTVVLMHLQYREDDIPFSEETFTAISRGFDGSR